MGRDAMEGSALRSLLALSMTKNLGYRSILGLLRAYGDPVRAYRMAREGRTPCGHRVEEIDERALERALRVIERKGVAVIDYNDGRYPVALKSLYDPPPILFARGDPSLLGSPSIAVVGTRGATRYGLRVSGWLGSVMAREGIAVVSGMARGIDTEAHRGCLDGGGETIAVLGTGIDVAYPPENRGLMERIAEAGCVVTEFPPGTPGLRQHFPRRNRIISGLSLGTVVVEAPQRSGALITAEFALDQGKTVFAVPGEIWSRNSLGPHALIRDGAVPVFDERDILDTFGWRGGTPRNEKEGMEETGHDLTSVSARIINCLGGTPIHVDDICSRCSLAPAEILEELLRLEMRGLVEQRPGKYFVLRRGAPSA